MIKINTKSGAEELALVVGACKDVELSLIPRTHMQNSQALVIPVPGSWNRHIPMTDWPTSPVEVVRTKTMRYCLK